MGFRLAVSSPGGENSRAHNVDYPPTLGTVVNSSRKGVSVLLLKRFLLISLLVTPMAIFPGLPAFAHSSQHSEDAVVLNPGGGAQADGSDGLRMIFNGASPIASNVGSDQVVYTNKTNWCCGGAGPVLNIGGTGYGEAGAARNSVLSSFDSLTVATTGAVERVAAGASVSSSATGNATATLTYSVTDGGLTYTVKREISYTFPNNYYDETWTVTIPATNTAEVKLYIGGDSAPGGSDAGIGSTVVAGGKRTIYEANPLSEQYFAYGELDAGQGFSHYFIGHYSSPYASIAAGNDLADTIDTTQHDAGIQVQFSLGSTPGSYVRTMRTSAGFNTEIPTEDSEVVTPEIVASCDPGIFLTLTGGATTHVNSSTIIYGSCLLTPGAAYSLSIERIGSTNESTLVDSGIIPQSGALEQRSRFPELNAGTHKVVFTSIHPGGYTLTLTNHVSVDASGTFTSISAEELQPHLR